MTYVSKLNNKGTHLVLAFDILVKTEHNSTITDDRGVIILPDTVSYNTNLLFLVSNGSLFAALKQSQTNKRK